MSSLISRRYAETNLSHPEFLTWASISLPLFEFVKCVVRFQFDPNCYNVSNLTICVRIIGCIEVSNHAIISLSDWSY